jgi:hypothetical protein
VDAQGTDIAVSTAAGRRLAERATRRGNLSASEKLSGSQVAPHRLAAARIVRARAVDNLSIHVA